MNPTSRACLLTAVAALTCLASECLAQGRTSGGTTSSLFSGGASSFGGSGFSSGGAGPGAISGAGQLGTGQSGSTTPTAQALNQQNASGFVGRDAAEVSAFFQGMNPLANQAAAGGFARGAMNRGRDANSTQDVRPPIMVNVKLGFRPPSRAIDAGRLTQSRLNTILQSRGFDDSWVTVDQGVALVSTTVAEPSRRLLIERLARLEPGVDRVEFVESDSDDLPAPN